MDFIRSKANLIVIAVIAILAVVGYFYYFGSGSGAAGAPLTSSSPSVQGQNVLAALNNLQSVKLKNAIFSNPVFQSLADFGITIPSQPTGRQNPFSPLPSVASSASLPQNIFSGTKAH